MAIPIGNVNISDTISAALLVNDTKGRRSSEIMQYSLHCQWHLPGCVRKRLSIPTAKAISRRVPMAIYIKLPTTDRYFLMKGLSGIHSGRGLLKRSLYVDGSIGVVTGFESGMDRLH
jgi:hypothetical protein